jgi:hypothetical protein
MAHVPGDERCKHGEIAAWCGESECMAARKGLPVRVWRTPYGSAYHRTPTCQALLEGHRMAGHYGRETHPAESVPLSVAMSDLLGECFHCFPENVPADAKPCQVLSGGVWVDGFLLEWQRGANGRWKGLVNYRHEAGRRVALKDQAELRPAGGSRGSSKLLMILKSLVRRKIVRAAGFQVTAARRGCARSGQPRRTPGPGHAQ